MSRARRVVGGEALGPELRYLMKSPTRKVVREAVLVVLLFSVWSTFEILTGYSEHARWYGLLSVAIAAGVATGTVPRWAGILMSERSVRSRKNTAKWKLIAVGALIAGCLGGGLMYLLKGLLGLSYFPALVFSMFLGLGVGYGIIGNLDDLYRRSETVSRRHR